MRLSHVGCGGMRGGVAGCVLGCIMCCLYMKILIGTPWNAKPIHHVAIAAHLFSVYVSFVPVRLFGVVAVHKNRKRLCVHPCEIKLFVATF